MSQESSFFDVLDADDGRRGGRLVWLVLGMFVALAAVGYLAAMRYADDRVPFGAQVSGVAIGGMTREQAVARLDDEFAAVPDRRISLVYDDDTYPLVPRRAGFDFDAQATVDSAGARTDRRGPGALWTFFTGGRSVDPRVDVDDAVFARVVQRWAGEIGRPVREATLRITATGLEAVPGRSGVDVDVDATRDLVRRVMFRPSATHAELPVMVREPYVDTAAVEEARRTIGEPAISGPVTFTLGGVRVQATPAEFAPTLSLIPNGRRLVLHVDGERLLARLAPKMRGLGDKPRAARLVLRDGRPHVVPSVVGVSYDVPDFEQAFARAVVARGTGRAFTLHAAVQEPSRTTAQVRALGVTALVGTFTVRATPPAAAVTDLDSTLVPVGQTFTVAGPLAGATFNAALVAGLPVTRPDVTRRVQAYPLGREASAPVVLTNDFDHAVLIGVRVVDGRLTVDLWSTSDRIVDVRPAACAADGAVVVRRVVRREGEAPSTDRFTAAYSNFTCARPVSQPTPGAIPEDGSPG